MKKLAILSLIISGLFSTLAAQSGRKLEPAPTPSPSVDESSYSDSTPVKTRKIPALQNNKTSQNQPVDPSADISSEDAIKIETNLITIPVSVFDRYGLYVPSLEQRDFKVFEDGTEQEIAYFATSENPFTVVLLLDTSLSTAYKIEEIQDAAIAFVNQLKPQDKVLVIEFDGNAHILAELTSDRNKITEGIRKADFGSGTSLYGTVALTFRKYLNKIEGRKAIVLFTDGVDTTSGKSTYESTVGDAEEGDAIIFPIYYNTFLENRRLLDRGVIRPKGTSRLDYAEGKKYIEDLAEVTGGRVFEAEAGARGLTRTFTSIADELRRQYSIGYYPKETASVGQRKQIKVRVLKPNLVVRARDSYVVGASAKP
jgi:VWFA-related protein